MTTIAQNTRFALLKKLLLALPFLAVLAVAIPCAQADDHYGYYQRHGYYRHHYHHGYGYRHYRWVHGRRYYYYGDYHPGVSLHIAL